MINREQIYSALFEKLAAADGFVTAERGLVHWNDCPAEMQPALYMVQKSETALPRSDAPTEWKLNVQAFIYARSDGDTSASVKMNSLLDAICARLATGPITSRLTLGELVHYARISGQIETDEGALGGQSVAIIPIEILVTD